MLPYIKIYPDFLNVVQELDNGARGRLLLAALQYANGEEPDELTGAERIAFIVLKSQIDRDAAAYEANAKKQSENGKKGGRPKNPPLSEKPTAFSGNPKKPKKPTAFFENPKKPEEEKEEDKDKEEDKEKDKEKDDSRELSDPNSLNKTSGSSDPTGCGEADALPPAAELELVDGTLFQISQKDVASLSTAYPDVEVLQQLREMEIWTQANPQNRKTARGIKRFVCSWLSREQDKAAARKNAPGKPGKIASWAPGELEKQAIARMMGNFEGGADDG